MVLKESIAIISIKTYAKNTLTLRNLLALNQYKTNNKEE